MHTLNIVGAGGIGKAAALIALNTPNWNVKVVIGDINQKALDDVVHYCDQHPQLETYLMYNDDTTISKWFDLADVVLDCLPGSLAPRIANLARKYNCHYANLTEYVKETNEIKGIAEGADTGFILQTGLAPGYINIWGINLLNDFMSRYEVDKVDDLQMKVGALTKTAIEPTFYGFTWSPIGVATEYIKDAVVVRDHNVVTIPALSEIQKLKIGDEWFEANFTSGGAADLPEALKRNVKNLDYRTLRYPGHYNWVKEVLQSTPLGEHRIQHLQETMLNSIPMYDEDVVMMYVHVTGNDSLGHLRRLDRSIKVEPLEIGGKKLSAIQASTAAPLLESAKMLLTGKYKGVILQSSIDPKSFLSGEIVTKVYGHQL